MTQNLTGTKKSPPGRKRSPETHQAIMKAALDILQTEGYRAISIEAIAAKAKVGKQTIYRWWPSKAAVVLEAFAIQTAHQIPAPNLGQLRADLIEFLTQTFQTLTDSGGPIVCSLMAEAQVDAAFGVAFREVFIAKRRAVLLEVLQRGENRGELAAGTDLNFLVDLIYGAMWYRLLNQHAPLDAHFARQLADLIVSKG